MIKVLMLVFYLTPHGAELVRVEPMASMSICQGHATDVMLNERPPLGTLGVVALCEIPGRTA